MNMLTGVACLHSAAYFSRVEFSRLRSFLGHLSSQFEHLPCLPDAVAARVDQVIVDTERSISRPLGQDGARSLLIAADLKKLRDTLRSPTFRDSLASQIPVEDRLQTTLDQAVSALAAIGLQGARPLLFFVDEIPPPYDKADYSAIATDQDDLSQHGITPGIYMVRSKLRPFYSQHLLCHELIHPVAAFRNPALLGRGLEEGLAELVGGMFLSMQVLGPQVARQVFVQNRLWYGASQFWDLYLDYTRQASYLYQRFGLVGLAELLRRGRDGIKEVELALLTNRFDLIELPSGGWDLALDELVASTTQAFCRNLVVSPLAKYLLPYVVAGRPATDILREAGVAEEQGMAALQELQERVVVSVLSDSGVVTLSDAPLLSSAGIIRYELSEP